MGYGNESVAEASMTPCSEQSGLCPACRVFGTVRDNGFAWSGKVRIHDSKHVDIKWERYSWKSERDPGDKSGTEGWILFRENDLWPVMSEKGDLVCVPAKAVFPFEVELADLDAEEQALLQFAITLRHGTTALVHKLGFGKALGLGSVVIDRSEDGEDVDEEPMRKYAEAAEIWHVLVDNRSEQG